MSALLAALAVLGVSAVSAVSAEARADATAAEKAAAETLFDDARRLMKERKYAEACPKLAESLRLDTGIGTMLYLADCYEKNGQPASAWAEFREAAGAANAAGQLEREKKARERAAALEPKLSRLAINVSSEATNIPGLVVKRDRVLVSRPLWGAAVPVDPGEHVIEASAPGRKRWSSKVTIVASAAVTSSMQVPSLEPEPVPIEPATPSAKDDLTGPSAKDGLVGPDAKTTASSEPPPSGTSAGRVVGIVLLGLGAAGLVTGGVTGGVAIFVNNASKPHCSPNNAVCDNSGQAERELAVKMAKASSFSLLVGGAVTAGGLITVLVSGRGGHRTKNAFRVGPLVGASEGGLLVEGAW